jgi:2-polyprenyl-3-methyl-5-hydroxy-6-metoxy-1,4-benzoquinol methylase
MAHEIIDVDSRPRLDDYIALWLLKLAKINRAKLGSGNGASSENFYEEFFDKKDDESYTKDLRMDVRRQTIENVLENYAPVQGNLIDIGCGLGDVLSSIPARYNRYGMDYSVDNVERAKRRLSGNADIRQGTIYDIPFSSESMDLCLCLEVLEHIEKDDKAVREIARLLKNGGLLISSVPYTFYWPEYFRLMGHYRHYTRESFQDLLSEAGFKIIRYLPNYPNWHQMYTRRYAITRALAATVGKIFSSKSVYDFKWPWSSRRELDRVAMRLEGQFKKDTQIDYAKDNRSTFVLAQKL